MIFRLIAIIFSIFALLACADNHGIEGSPQEVSIAYLKSLCKGEHYRITQDYSISGVIVATDWLGEFYKSAVIVDKTGGLEFAIDSRNIKEHLPVYSEVTILCNGLMLAHIGGKIELGAPPTSDFPLDNIDDTMFDRYIRVIGLCKDFTPKTKQFSEISLSDISAVVCFENIRICDEEQDLAWCDIVEGRPITTYRTFIDHKDNTFAIRTLSDCIYATKTIPEKEITVIGVIDYSDNRYFLRIVNKSIIE